LATMERSMPGALKCDPESDGEPAQHAAAFTRRRGIAQTPGITTDSSAKTAIRRTRCRIRKSWSTGSRRRRCGR
jgi:hypothetical protein